MNTSHAITPTDTREPPRPALHPTNVAHREHSAQVLNLALQIADEAVRTEIECYAARVEQEGWMSIKAADVTLLLGSPEEEAERRQYVDRAIRYIGLRHPDAFPWRFIRHPDQPHLVRFEDR